MAFDFELFVIGGGSGGVRAARVAAKGGARVGIAEEDRFGGTCVIRGCVPKKLMVYAAGFREMFEDAKAYGWTFGQPKFDWQKFIAAKDIEIARLEAVYQAGLDRAGARVFHCRAKIVDPHRVKLATGEIFAAKHILVATGGHPMRAEFRGAELAITSNEVFQLPDLPKRVLIVGGGYIASEFACILHGMGSVVTQAYRGAQILRGFDGDLRNLVANEMQAKGIDLRMGVDLVSIAKVAGRLKVGLAKGGFLDVDCVMLATGRVPNSAAMGLKEAGVVLGQKGEIVVDQWSQTNVPSIYAVGDVTDRLALTPVAIREAIAFVSTVFEGKPMPMDHSQVPTAVFTRPEIGTVGLSEEAARELGEVVVYKSTFRPMYSDFAGRKDRMLMKLVVDKSSRRVLGVHIVGPSSAEMIQAVGIAIKMGATKEDFDRTFAVHPTAAEELVTMRDEA